MLICIDVGNTHIVVGVYNENEDNFTTYRLSTNSSITSDELGIKMKELLSYNNKDNTKYEFIVSNVVPKLDFTIKNMCKKFFNCDAIFVGPGIKSGIKIKIDNPKELGADLLVGAVSAVNQYGSNVLVIDMGTALTLTYINSEKELVGGTILPGIGTSFSGLISLAARLEDFSFGVPKSLIGRDTKSCLQSGMIFGFSSMVEGLIEKYHEKLGPFTTVFTGGEANFLKEFLNIKEDWIFDDSLLMRGLKILYDKNK